MMPSFSRHTAAYNLPRAWRVVLLPLFLFGTLCTQSSGQTGASAVQEEVVIPRGGVARVVFELENADAIDSGHLLSALVLSGPRSLSGLVDLLNSRIVPDVEALDTKQRSQIREALTGIPAWLRIHPTPGASEHRKDVEMRIGLGIIGHFGSAQDIPHVLAHFDTAADGSSRSITLAKNAEVTLSALVERDRRAVTVLSSQFSGLSLGTKEMVLRAVGSCATEASLDFLLTQMDREEELSTVLLGQVGRVVEVGGIEVDAYTLHYIQRELISQDPRVLREACQALGRVGSIEPVGDLIELLEFSDPVVVETAHWALERITGVSFPPTRSRWQRWWTNEQTWWQSGASPLLRDLSSGNPAVVGAALRELSSHMLYRHEIAAEIVPLLQESHRGVVSQACAVLQVLRSHVAIEPLRDLILDGQSPALDHAREALKRCER
jgi:hypothetical protein